MLCLQIHQLLSLAEVHEVQPRRDYELPEDIDSLFHRLSLALVHDIRRVQIKLKVP